MYMNILMDIYMYIYSRVAIPYCYSILVCPFATADVDDATLLSIAPQPCAQSLGRNPKQQRHSSGTYPLRQQTRNVSNVR